MGSAEPLCGVRRLRARLARIEADYDEDLIDGRQYRVATEKVRAEMETAQARLAASAPGHALRGSCRVPEIRQPRSTPLL